MSDNLTVLYFGVYDPDYSRNRVLIKGLKANGVRVVECRVSAKDKLKFSKSEFLTILEEIKKNPKAEGVKIIR